jgi:hypothetical protein
MKKIADRHGLQPAENPLIVTELSEKSVEEMIAEAPIDYYYVYGFVCVLWVIYFGYVCIFGESFD